MELIKVNREIGNRLNELLKDSRYSKESIFKKHNSSKWEEENNKILNNLNSYEMARCLFEGFEIQDKPQDKIKNDYLSLLNLKIKDEFDRGYESGYRNAVEMVLHYLDIKIEGVND